MNVDAYLREISDLGRRLGIGITGSAQLYELAQEDALFDYSIDADGRLILGSLRDADADTGARAGRNAESCLDTDAATNVG